MLRPGSPPWGFSTLTTSAPSHASASVHEGPASNCERSSTRTPERQASGFPLACIAFHLPSVRYSLSAIKPRVPLQAQRRPAQTSPKPPSSPRNDAAPKSSPHPLPYCPIALLPYCLTLSPPASP